MAEIEVKDWNNKAVGKLALNPAVVDYPLKEHLIYEAVLAHRAAGRAGTHATKNRKNVSGGTRKLWRQKGTGRARMGDNRSPLWRHGGTVHGPQPRDYSWKMPKKMRRNALRSALAQKLRDAQVVCLKSMAIDSPKTKQLETALSGKLGITAKALLVSHDEQMNLQLAARNNPRLKVVGFGGVNIVDLLHHDTLVISESALQSLCEVLAP